MYCNPINATNQTFGCDGSTVLEHLFVYWVGPLSATALVVFLHDRIQGTRPATELRALKDETDEDRKVKEIAESRNAVAEVPAPLSQNGNYPRHRKKGGNRTAVG